MRKLILSIIILLSLNSLSYGAPSEDIYVRKDVFEVHLQSINTNIERVLQKLDTLDRTVNELTQSVAVMSERIDRNFETLSSRIDGLDARVGDLRNDIYLGLVLLGIIVALPTVQKFLERRDEIARSRKELITLEQVERLIEAKLSEK